MVPREGYPERPISDDSLYDVSVPPPDLEIGSREIRVVFQTPTPRQVPHERLVDGQPTDREDGVAERPQIGDLRSFGDGRSVLGAGLPESGSRHEGQGDEKDRRPRHASPVQAQHTCCLSSCSAAQENHR